MIALNFARLDTGRIQTAVDLPAHRISFNTFSNSFGMAIGNRLAKCALLSLLEVHFQLAIQYRLVSNGSHDNLISGGNIFIMKRINS